MINRGIGGEKLVAQWLQQDGWTILHHRWRCRWGELDLIAQREEMLVFVEVKTRSSGNWDQQGLLAISGVKQQKLHDSAEFFLAQFPQWGDCVCRFDVALVYYHGDSEFSESLGIYQVLPFTLVDYLCDAF